MEKTKKLAVLRIGGKQYLASEGDEILVDKMGELKAKPEVLLFADSGILKVGKPVISDISVKSSIVTQLEKGEKVTGFKYKAKSRYRKRYGFRHSYTRVKIEKLG